MRIVGSLQVHLENLRYFETVKTTIFRLTEWERKFYSVQQDAIKQIPKALAELDKRLGIVLAQTPAKEMHTVAAGVEAGKTPVATSVKQFVRDTPGKMLARVEDEARAGRQSTTTSRNPQSMSLSKGPQPIKDSPDQFKTTGEAPNTKRQAITDAAVAADRERVTELSKAGKIREARDILQPYVDTARNAKTVVEREAAMNAIVLRLDVTSDKEKMFWSGDKELARKIANSQGKTILEETPGGKIIDGWDDLDSTFSWDSKQMPPHGWNLWGNVSENYARGASGEIDIIQNIDKFPSGGPTWKGREWPAIVDEGRVTSLNIFGMDRDGNILDKITIQPDSVTAYKLFDGK